MVELTPRYTWVLELSTEELVLISDALIGRLTTDTAKSEAFQLGNALLSKRVQSAGTQEKGRKKR